MHKKLALLILSLGAAASAQAHDGGPFGFSPPPPPPPHEGRGSFGAPEIDPASAMSAFTLLAGGLVLIRGRRAGK